MPQVVAIRKGCVWLKCTTNDGLLSLYVGLDFRSEGIAFDLKQGITLVDDGSADAMRHGLDDNRFFRDLVQLGELEIWNADTQILLGRADPLIPENISMRGTLANLDHSRAKLESTLKQRMDAKPPELE